MAEAVTVVTSVGQSNPPWLLWGNTQTVRAIVQPAGAGLLPVPNVNTLVRVDYHRPETWHWLFQARLLAGPNNTPGSQLTVIANFNVIVGVGRSAIRVQGVLGTQSRPLEGFTFIMGPSSTGFPVGAQLWSTGGQFSRLMSTEAVLPGVEAYQLVADTIVCDVSVTASADVGNVLALGNPVDLEVSAAFAPVAHVRPDWYRLETSEAEQFPGGEIGGR